MVASNVKKLMEEKGVTIRGMAAKTLLADMTIIRARGDKITQCKLETLQIIAKHLKCKIKDLFDED